MIGDDKLMYKPMIEARYPSEDYKDGPLPEHLPMV